MLAGGRGARLGGRDKPSLVVGGRTLLAAVVAAGVQAGARQVIVVGPPRAGLDGVSFVTEQPPGAGPVPALRRGLAEAWPEWVAVLAADLPFLRPADLGALLQAAAGHHGAVLADDAGRAQWLAGCWRDREPAPRGGRLPGDVAGRPARPACPGPGPPGLAARRAAALARLRHP